MAAALSQSESFRRDVCPMDRMSRQEAPRWLAVVDSTLRSRVMDFATELMDGIGPRLSAAVVTATMLYNMAMRDKLLPRLAMGR